MLRDGLRIPSFDEEAFIERQTGLTGEVNSIDRSGTPVSEPQPDGVELQYRFFQFATLYAYLGAEPLPIQPQQLEFFSTFPRRRNDGQPRDVRKSRSLNSSPTSSFRNTSAFTTARHAVREGL